jgi:electron transport complex protein RnfB
MIAAIISLALLGCIFGIVLGVASQKFKVEVDERVERVLEVLPGANCGGCGYAGCGGLADAIIAGQAKIDACVPGKAAVAQKIAAIMGVEVQVSNERKVAQVRCKGGKEFCRDQFAYDGVQDCVSANNYFGGQKACFFGCLGFGNCAKSCKFNALSMGENNIPVVDYEKCTACGKCVLACPKKLIELVDIKHQVHVRCKNIEKGKDAKSKCSVACIKCKLCEKNCPTGAIKVNVKPGGSIAEIDYALCTNCGKCVEVCPSKVITQDEMPKGEGIIDCAKPQTGGCGSCPGAKACGK